LALTDVAGGVKFDIVANGTPINVAWTRADSNDAFLALDRNHNGLIDSGAELFGNFTSQAPSAKRGGANGFLALQVFDDPANGGNGDGQITDDDAIWPALRLWVDANHDGVSQADELRSLADNGVRAISLHYVQQKTIDEFGNLYRFRSLVTMDKDAADLGGPIKRRAVDVFFKHSLVR